MDVYQPIIDAINKSKRILITTHVRPDGDALGTTSAMVMGLRQLGIESEVLLLSHLPTKYAFIYRDNGIVHHDVEKGWPQAFPWDRYDCLLVMDTGTWSQLPGLKDQLNRFQGIKLVLDHHLTQEDWADIKLVVTEAAAAGEICGELLERMGVQFDHAIATSLFLALITDTGWFQYSNTRPFTLRLAARLMEAGVDSDRLYKLLYQNERFERIALQTRAMQSLKLLGEGRLAVLQVSRQDFLETRADVPDTENLINLPLQIKSVEVSILLTEPVEGVGPVRVSLRSKGGVDVARFAQPFGGGGHARAAGLKLEMTLKEAGEKVVGTMLETLGAGGV